MTTQAPSPDIIERVELHLPIWPMSAAAIWKRQRERYWTRGTFKRALDYLTEIGRANRMSERRPCGTPRPLYCRACERMREAA